MNCATRRAVPSDAVAACDVVRRSIIELCYDDHRGDPTSLASWLANKTPVNFERWIGSGEHVALVAERDSELVGFGLLSLEGSIALLYVSPDARFGGVSKLLLSALEHAATATSIHELNLESSATAFSFYKRRGYASTGPPFQAFGITMGYPMSRQMSAGS
jgi:putative acetyltransferase